MRTVSNDKLLESEPRLEWHGVCIEFVVSPSGRLSCWLSAGCQQKLFTGSRAGTDRRAVGRSSELACSQTLHLE